MIKTLRFKLVTLFACGLVFILSACNSNDAKSAEETQNFPEETQRIVSLAVLNLSDNDSFLSKLNSEVSSNLTELDDLNNIDKFDLIFINNETGISEDILEVLNDVSMPYLVYNQINQVLPDGINQIEGKKSFPESFEKMMEYALVYPPHDTPVRLAAVFSSENSSGKSKWETYVTEGKVLPKAIFPKEETSIEEWVDELLTDYYPGMLDAICVEDNNMAVTIVNKLIENDRFDFEIFTVGENAQLLEIAKSHPDLLPQTIEFDDTEVINQINQLVQSIQ